MTQNNLLFICSRNQWRSPTAEALWRNHPNHNARSAGTHSSARHTVNAKDIQWADVIFVMEKEHKKQLTQRFLPLLACKPIHILDIPDMYQYMDEELIDELKARVNNFL